MKRSFFGAVFKHDITTYHHHFRISPGHGSQQCALRLSLASPPHPALPAPSAVTAEARAAQAAAETMAAQGVLCSTGGHTVRPGAESMGKNVKLGMKMNEDE